MIGQKFGKLKVVEKSESDKGYKAKFKCLCECGNVIDVRADALKSGHTKSCGCIKRNPNKYTIKDDICIGTDCNGFEFVIDADDYEKVSKYTWTKLNTGYFITTSKRKQILLHRFVTDCHGNEIVDHINNNCSDNRKSNLRIRSHSEKQANQKLSKNNTSGVKGVSFHKSRGKWIASIEKDYKQHYLGSYSKLSDAANAYDKAAKEMFGEYARLNNYMGDD